MFKYLNFYFPYFNILVSHTSFFLLFIETFIPIHGAMHHMRGLLQMKICKGIPKIDCFEHI